MSDDNRINDEDRQKKNGDFKMPSRNWIIWIAIICSVLLVVLLKDRMETQGELLSQNEFTHYVEADAIKSATIKFNPQSQMMTEIVGSYLKGGKDGEKEMVNGKEIERPFRTKVLLTKKQL